MRTGERRPVCLGSCHCYRRQCTSVEIKHGQVHRDVVTQGETQQLKKASGQRNDISGL